MIEIVNNDPEYLSYFCFLKNRNKYYEFRKKCLESNENRAITKIEKNSFIVNNNNGIFLENLKYISGHHSNLEDVEIYQLKTKIPM